MSDEPLAHIARSPLPWRDTVDNDTECGKAVAEFAKVISFDEAAALTKKLGRQRAAFVLCMTCCETALRWAFHAGFNYRVAPMSQCTFDAAPTERLSREFGKRREQTDRELRAMGELVVRYRQEFDDLLSGAVVPIAELRRQRAVTGGPQ